MDRLLLALRALGPARILAFLLGLGAVIAIMGMVAGNLTKPGMSLMYGGLSPAESSSMSTWLETQGVEYEIKQDGSVYVPSNKVGDLRLKSAGQGLVGSSTMGYEVFDKSSGFGTTSFMQNINARRALEGELARTIASLPAVSSARVHLVIPQKKLFEKSGATPSAAVALNLSGRLLGDGHVENIAKLVASAVPNLTLDHVTIIDQSGNMLFDGSDKNGSNGFSSHMKNTIEAHYEKSLTSMLTKVVGAGKVSVKVTAEINTDRIEEQSEIFNPQQQVVRSENKIEENSSNNQSAGGGQVGLTGNIPGGEGSGAGGSNSKESNQRTEENIKYEISRTLRNIIKKGGEIKRLSVAVLIEGKYEDDGAGATTYKPWSDDDIDRFTTLIKSAIGFNKERGDSVKIIDMQFSKMPEIESVEPPFLSKADMFKLAEYGVMLVGLLLVIFMIIKPALNSLNNAVISVAPAAPMATGGAPMPAGATPMPNAGGTSGASETTGTIDMSQVEGRVKESTIKQVNEIIDQHPEESLNVIRGWMAEK